LDNLSHGKQSWERSRLGIAVVLRGEGLEIGTKNNIPLMGLKISAEKKEN
jgi:hypothetical protein